MRSRRRGQAALEAALTLPLTVFLFLGILQMFLVAQGRVLGQVAAYRATRVGSTNHGNCDRMIHAAVLSVLPAITTFLGGSSGGTPAEKLAEAFRVHRLNRYDDRYTDGAGQLHYTGAIIWVGREQPRAADVQALGTQDAEFDQPARLMRLETRLIFWFPLKIPFANWVLSRMWLAHYGLRPMTSQNPALLSQKANWEPSQDGYQLDRAVAQELAERAANKEYVFPIETTWTMRMMSPAKADNFRTQNCPPTPERL